MTRTRVPVHGHVGTTRDGVAAYSNGNDSHWTNEKHYKNNLFMGYKWQCVEFARRWLWEARGLYLPSKSCAYCFAGLSHVYRPVPAVVRNVGATDALPDSVTDVEGGSLSKQQVDESASEAVVTAEDYSTVRWEKHPCTYHKQGSRTAPTPGSLIIYPMSFGSPWGHIGVIVDVDMDAGLVYVADQNRYFHHWGSHGYSATFPLEVVKGRHYIRDHESECKGWLVC